MHGSLHKIFIFWQFCLAILSKTFVKSILILEVFNSIRLDNTVKFREKTDKI